MSYNKEYYQQYYLRRKALINTETRRQYNKEAAARWRLNNREAAMLSAAKARAKKAGLDFDINLSDFSIPEMCPILEIPLFFTEGLQADNTPALDRIDNSKGYVKGNVRVISHKANRHKADLSLEDIERLYIYTTPLKKLA